MIPHSYNMVQGVVTNNFTVFVVQVNDAVQVRINIPRLGGFRILLLSYVLDRIDLICIPSQNSSSGTSNALSGPHIRLIYNLS